MELDKCIQHISKNVVSYDPNTIKISSATRVKRNVISSAQADPTYRMVRFCTHARNLRAEKKTAGFSHAEHVRTPMTLTLKSANHASAHTHSHTTSHMTAMLRKKCKWTGWTPHSPPFVSYAKCVYFGTCSDAEELLNCGSISSYPCIYLSHSSLRTSSTAINILKYVSRHLCVVFLVWPAAASAGVRPERLRRKRAARTADATRIRIRVDHARNLVVRARPALPGSRLRRFLSPFAVAIVPEWGRRGGGRRHAAQHGQRGQPQCDGSAREWRAGDAHIGYSGSVWAVRSEWAAEQTLGNGIAHNLTHKNRTQNTESNAHAHAPRLKCRTRMIEMCNDRTYRPPRLNERVRAALVLPLVLALATRARAAPTRALLFGAAR